MIDYASAFLKVPRAVIEAIGPNANVLAVYLTILARVRWEAAARLNTARGIVDLDIGQCVLGREEIAAAVGISVRSARTAISALANLGIIAQQTTNKGTTVTLPGFKETHDPNGAERPANRPASDQQATTTKKEDQSSDLSFFGADPEPRLGGRGDLVQRLGPIAAPRLFSVPELVEPKGLAAFEEAMRIANGQGRP